MLSLLERRIIISQQNKGDEEDTYDARVEYIESTGAGEYIATPIKLQFPIRCRARWQYLGSQSGGSICMLGSRVVAGRNDKFAWWVNSGNKVFALNYGSMDTGYIINGVSNTGEMVDTESEADHVYADGVEVYHSPVSITTLNSDACIYVFGISIANGAVDTRGIRARLAELEIENAIGQRVDMIAVRSNGEGCMFDQIERKLYHNLGGGAFVLGNDIIE